MNENLDEIRNDFIEAGDDSRSERARRSAAFDAWLAQEKAAAWERGLNTGVGFQMAVQIMGPSAPYPENPYGEEKF